MTIIANAYAEAYEGSDMNAEEIWEEIICDSLGDMNIFASVELLGEMNSEFLTELKEEVKKDAKSERGPPTNESRASRELNVNSAHTKITANMTEEARYEALKKRSINIPPVAELSDSILKKVPEISSWDELNNHLGSKKRKIIHKLAVEFGTIGKEYGNDDIQLSFVFSNNNFNETYKKQQKNYATFAKMFSVFDSVVENAIGIEIHNRTDYKPDPTLDNVFVLISAYQDGEFIIPVKLEVKKFKDKQNTLYIAISLEKIKKTEVLGRGNTENGVTQQPRSVNISIAQIFKKINPSDKKFLKYIPDGFLDEKQKAAKAEALLEDKSNPGIRFSRELDIEGMESVTSSAPKLSNRAGS